MGYMFLIVVDAFTKWLEVKPVKSATSATTMDQLRSIFATHGLPEMLVTDNGTVFTSMEFQQFTKRNGIRHVKTAPYHPASNGLAERAVQTFKEHMKKSSNDSIETQVARFLFSYRRTPHSTTGIAPAELLLGRLPRSHLDLVKPNLQEKVRSKQFLQTKYHDNQAQERHFEVGDKVFILDLPAKKQWMPGTICALNGQVTYWVELVDGRIVRRHIDHIRVRTSVETPPKNDLAIPSPPVASAGATAPATPVPSLLSPPPSSLSSLPTTSPPQEPSPPTPLPSTTLRRSERVSRPPDRFSYGSKS